MTVSQGIADIANRMESEGDFVKLGERKFYDPYFLTLTFALQTLSKWFRNQKELGHGNVWIFHSVIDRLLTTIGLLRLKQQYDIKHETSLDLNESGFPHSSAINQLSADILRRDEELVHIPTANRARLDLLDSLLINHVEDEKLLWDVARRVYFEQLQKGKIFEQFNLHSIAEYPEWVCKKPNRRPYLVTWGCFDQVHNLPFLHLMIIEQDDTAEPLTQNNKTSVQFLNTLRAEGSRFVELGFMGQMIDNTIESVHPKMIRRIKIGPFYSREVKFGKTIHPIVDFLHQHTDDKKSFVLEFEIEDLLSVDESIIRQGILKKDGIRQVFLIPMTDYELKTRRVSGVHKYVLMPHQILQSIDWGSSQFERWKKHHKVTIDKQGEINDF